VSLSSQDYGTAAEHERLARGERQYWIVSEAELEGERIRATLAAPGSDWMWVSDDGFWRPDVRAPFKTHDGATVLMHYTGLVEQNASLQGRGRSGPPNELGRSVHASHDPVRYRRVGILLVEYEPLHRARAPSR
jgi:Protein of unknown function (DUF3237)